MLIARRLLLLLMVFAVPLALTVASYAGAQYVLAATHRVISAQTIQMVTMVEFACFFFIALLEAKAHWGAPPPN